MKNNKIITFLLLISVILCMPSCSTESNSDKSDNVDYTIGMSTPFNDDTSLISRSDKECVYYDDGSYIIVRDNIVRQLQYCDVVPYSQTLIDYLNTFTDFSQANATIICTAMDGTQTKFDMSTTWENCTFGEMIVYWKTTDSKGFMVTLYPGSTAIVNEYLYYSDLSELIGDPDNDEISTVEDSENSDNIYMQSSNISETESSKIDENGEIKSSSIDENGEIKSSSIDENS